MHNKKIIGNIGEKIAAQYLEKSGYIINKMNFYCKHGEIDIIAKFENAIIFVEVKTRTSLNYGYPIDSINHEKLMHIKKSAKHYMYINKIYNVDIRFDAIEVYLGNFKYKINHIKDIIN